MEECGIQTAVMVMTMSCRASELLGIEDAYAAWCMDEAICTIIQSLKAGRKRRPPKDADNNALIERIRREQGETA